MYVQPACEHSSSWWLWRCLLHDLGLHSCWHSPGLPNTAAAATLVIGCHGGPSYVGLQVSQAQLAVGMALQPRAGGIANKTGAAISCSTPTLFKNKAPFVGHPSCDSSCGSRDCWSGCYCCFFHYVCDACGIVVCTSPALMISQFRHTFTCFTCTSRRARGAVFVFLGGWSPG